MLVTRVRVAGRTLNKWSAGGVNYCLNGKVSLPKLKPHPVKLLNLMTQSNCQDFRKHIRKYNSAIAFASFGRGKRMNHAVVKQYSL